MKKFTNQEFNDQEKRFMATLLEEGEDWFEVYWCFYNRYYLLEENRQLKIEIAKLRKLTKHPK